MNHGDRMVYLDENCGRLRTYTHRPGTIEFRNGEPWFVPDEGEPHKVRFPNKYEPETEG